MNFRFTIPSLFLLAVIVAIPIADRVAQVRGRDRILDYLSRNHGSQASLNFLDAESFHVESFAGETNIVNERSFAGAIEAKNRSLFQRLFIEQSYGIEQLNIRIGLKEEAVEWSELLSQPRALRGLRVLTCDLKDSSYPFDKATFERLDDVKFLRLKNFSVNKALIDSLVEMNDLELLDLSGCKQVDLMELQGLRESNTLAWLRADCRELSDEQILSLRTALPRVYVTVE